MSLTNQHDIFQDEPTDKGYDAQVAKAGNPEDYGNVEVKQEKE